MAESQIRAELWVEYLACLFLPSRVVGCWEDEFSSINDDNEIRAFFITTLLMASFFVN